MHHVHVDLGKSIKYAVTESKSSYFDNMLYYYRVI